MATMVADGLGKKSESGVNVSVSIGICLMFSQRSVKKNKMWWIGKRGVIFLFLVSEDLKIKR